MSKVRQLKLTTRISAYLIRSINSSFKVPKDIKINQKIIIQLRPKRARSVCNSLNHNIVSIEERKTIKENNINNLNLIAYKNENKSENNYLLNLNNHPPSKPLYYLENFNLNLLNIYSNSNNNYGILTKGIVPIFFYNHLLIGTEIAKIETQNYNKSKKKSSQKENTKNNLKRLVLTVRKKTKIVYIVFYTYGKLININNSINKNNNEVI